MSFAPDMVAAREAIRSACSATGWKATLVDETQFHDGINEILALMKRAFAIADFMHHRGGVYFEAGFGRGLGKPVIHTVHGEHLASTHFDTKHLNHIVWSSPEDLERKLKARIADATPGRIVPSRFG